jgi:hypothetical protein
MVGEVLGSVGTIGTWHPLAGGTVTCALLCRVAPDHLGGFPAAGLHDGWQLLAIAQHVLCRADPCAVSADPRCFIGGQAGGQGPCEGERYPKAERAVRRRTQRKSVIVASRVVSTIRPSNVTHAGMNSSRLKGPYSDVPYCIWPWIVPSAAT